MIRRLKRVVAEHIDTSKFPIDVTLREDRVVILEGEVPDWNTADTIAHRIAKFKKSEMSSIIVV